MCANVENVIEINLNEVMEKSNNYSDSQNYATEQKPAREQGRFTDLPLLTRGLLLWKSHKVENRYNSINLSHG